MVSPKRYTDLVSAIRSNIMSEKGCIMTLVNFGIDYRARCDASRESVCTEMKLCAGTLNLLLQLSVTVSFKFFVVLRIIL